MLKQQGRRARRRLSLQSRWLRICRSPALGSAGPGWGQGTIWMKGKKDNTSEQATLLLPQKGSARSETPQTLTPFFFTYSQEDIVSQASSLTPGLSEASVIWDHAAKKETWRGFKAEWTWTLPLLLLWVSPGLVLPASATDLLYKLSFLFDEDFYEL